MIKCSGLPEDNNNMYYADRDGSFAVIEKSEIQYTDMEAEGTAEQDVKVTETNRDDIKNFDENNPNPNIADKIDELKEFVDVYEKKMAEAGMEVKQPESDPVYKNEDEGKIIPADELVDNIDQGKVNPVEIDNSHMNLEHAEMDALDKTTSSENIDELPQEDHQEKPDQEKEIEMPEPEIETVHDEPDYDDDYEM